MEQFYFETGNCTIWVLISERTRHLHMLVMSGELWTGVDHYTLIALAGAELGLMEQYYEESSMSRTTP